MNIAKFLITRIMKRKNKRLLIFVLSSILTILGMYLILKNASKNAMFFLEPTELLQSKKLYIGKEIKIGGLVALKSLKYNKNEIQFYATDCKTQILILYTGVLPNLFREGQGIIAYGKYNGEFILATRLLTKHDEYYYPKESANKRNTAKCK